MENYIMAFNPNVQNNKKPQDSPFLTLSQRTKQGLSSDNIKGTQQAFSTQKTDSKNIFGQDEAQGIKQDGAWFQQEEKSAEEYLQEDEKGDVSFDEQGFYDDAWGISLSKGVTDPIKAGSSKDAYSLKNDLKTAVKQGNNSEVNDIKDQLSAQGVSNAEIDTIEQSVQSDSGNAQKAGASSTASTTQKTGASSTKSSSQATSEYLSDEQASTMVENGASYEEVSIAYNPNNSWMRELRETYNIGSKADYETMQATATARNKDGSAKTSSNNNSSDGSSNSTQTNWGQTIGTAVVNGGISAGTSAVMKPVTEPISKGGSDVMDWVGDKTGIKKAWNSAFSKDKPAENLEQAKQQLGDAKTAEKGAKTDAAKADKNVDKAKADEGTAKNEVNESEADKTAATQKKEEHTNAQENAMESQESHTSKSQNLDSEISQLDAEISELNSQIASCGNDTAKKAKLEAKKAEKEVEKAEKETEKMTEDTLAEADGETANMEGGMVAEAQAEEGAAEAKNVEAIASQTAATAAVSTATTEATNSNNDAKSAGKTVEIKEADVKNFENNGEKQPNGTQTPTGGSAPQAKPTSTPTAAAKKPMSDKK